MLDRQLHRFTALLDESSSLTLRAVYYFVFIVILADVSNGREDVCE